MGQNPQNPRQNENRFRVSDKVKNWNGIVRLAAMLTAIMVWWVGITFSVDGFAFQLPQYRWAGYVLGIAVTVIELVFVEEGMRHGISLLLFSLLAFAYDVITNILGVWVAQGQKEMGTNFATAFVIALALILALLPEPLFTWGLLGESGHDALTKLME